MPHHWRHRHQSNAIWGVAPQPSVHNVARSWCSTINHCARGEQRCTTCKGGAVFQRGGLVTALSLARSTRCWRASMFVGSGSNTALRVVGMQG